MKKNLTLILIGLLCTATVFAQKSKTKAKKTKAKQEQIGKTDKKQSVVQEEETDGAKIVFEKESHEFGTVEEAGKITYTFDFKNEGTEPLILTSVRASCGCTTPNWPREPIMPGESNKIDVTYNTKGRIGNFNKAITIQHKGSSKKETPGTVTKKIYIKGKVVRPTNAGAPKAKPSMLNANGK